METEIKGSQKIVCSEGGEHEQLEFTSLLCNFNVDGKALDYISSLPTCTVSWDHNLLYVSFVLGSRRK